MMSERISYGDGLWGLSSEETGYPLLTYFSDVVGAACFNDKKQCWEAILYAVPYSEEEDNIIGEFASMKEAADALWAERYSASAEN